MVDERYMTDAELDTLLSAAREDRPGEDLAARVLADALAVQGAATAAPPAHAPDRVGWFAGLIGAVGGWGAASGITAAGVMGLALGLYAPDTVASLMGDTSLPFVSEGYGVTPDLADLWTEADDV